MFHYLIYLIRILPTNMSVMWFMYCICIFLPKFVKSIFFIYLSRNMFNKKTFRVARGICMFSLTKHNKIAP